MPAKPTANRGLALAALLLMATAAPLAESANPPLPPHEPIWIRSDDGFWAPHNGVIQGTGTAEDPFVIAGWDISPRTGYGIRLENTTRHVLIQGNMIRDGDRNPPIPCHYRLFGVVVCVDDVHLPGIGIELRNTTNVALIGNTLPGNTLGIAIHNSESILVQANHLRRTHEDPILRTLDEAARTAHEASLSTSANPGLTVIEWPRRALYVEASNDVAIRGNHIAGFLDNNNILTPFAISLLNTQFAFEGNLLEHSERGLLVVGSSGTITSNHIHNISQSLAWIKERTHVTVRDNLIRRGTITVCGGDAEVRVASNLLEAAHIQSFGSSGYCDPGTPLRLKLEGNAFRNGSSLLVSSPGDVIGNTFVDGGGWVGSFRLAIWVEDHDTLVQGNTICCTGIGIVTRFSGARIEDNIITNNTYGVVVSRGPEKPTLRNNSLLGNTLYDVFNTDANFAPNAPPGTIAVDARYNWWGDPSAGGNTYGAVLVDPRLAADPAS